MATEIPYANVCLERGPEYYEYTKFEPEWDDMEGIEIVKSLGRGKYSEVFEAYDATIDKPVVVKILKPVRNSKILREIKILQDINGGVNCIKMLRKGMDERHKTISIVFEYVYKENFREVSQKLSDMECRFYLYQLLLALEYTHSQGIVHRDVKPRNIVVNPETKQLKLIDWGLSEYYLPEQEYNVRVASRAYKGPELLVNYKKYGYSLDMWSAGCVFGSMIFRVYHIFIGRDNYDQLVKISKILGTKDLYAYAEKYDCDLNKKEYSKLKPRSGKGWEYYFNEENEHLRHPQALDLLNKMMVYDHAERILPSEAMKHPYFDPIRNMV